MSGGSSIVDTKVVTSALLGGLLAISVWKLYEKSTAAASATPATTATTTSTAAGRRPQWKAIEADRQRARDKGTPELVCESDRR